MAIKLVSHPRQQGTSLIELLVASTISLLAIGVVGSIYIKGNQMALERASQLMVKQDVNDALRMMSDELKRAGFNTALLGSAKLLSAANIIVATSDEIGFVYEDEDSKWRGIKFRKKLMGNVDVIQMCQRKSNFPATVGGPDFSYAQLCTDAEVASILDYKSISVDYFKVSTAVVSSASKVSTHINLELKADVIGTTYSHTGYASLLLRNFQ